MARVKSTVLVAIDLEQPENWTQYDIHDVVCFHLDTGHLNDEDVDISEVEILGCRIIDLEVHHE